MADLPPAPASSLKEVVRNDYCIVTHDPARNIVRFHRTSTPVRTLEEAKQFFGSAERVVTALGRSRIKLIVDLRDAPVRNDPQFEKAMAEHRKELARGIERVAVIVKTAVGRLHVERLGKSDSLDQIIVSNDADAVRFLTRQV